MYTNIKFENLVHDIVGLAVKLDENEISKEELIERLYEVSGKVSDLKDEYEKKVEAIENILK